MESLSLSQETCETLPESHILTESEPESQLEPELPHTPEPEELHSDLTRDQRLQVKTALLFHVPWAKIRETLHVSNRQISYANRHRATPQKKKRVGKKPFLTTPRCRELQTWLLESPSHRHVPWRRIPLFAPQFHDAGPDAITTAMHLLGYERRRAVKKGFLDDPRVMAERVRFAQEAIL